MLKLCAGTVNIDKIIVRPQHATLHYIILHNNELQKFTFRKKQSETVT